MKKHWTDLDPRLRKALVAGAAIDGIGRIAALIDLSRRSPAKQNGNKVGWLLAVTVVTSAGILPATYFLRARR